MKGIIIDDDRGLNYESNSPVRKMANMFFNPVLRMLPSGSIEVLKKTHPSAQVIVDHATTYKAMEVLYNRTPRADTNRFQNFFLSIWLGTNNSKAVRNRLRLVKREIRNKILELASENREINILNIASGSSRAVLESSEELGDNVKLSAVFIDKDHEAISFSQQLAKGHKYNSSFRWFNDSADVFLNTRGLLMRFNIVEIVGLLEYLNDEDAVALFSKAYSKLDPDGILVTANIIKNVERRFIHEVVGWKMMYRSADELSSLLISAGFNLDKMKIFYEPQRVHCVIVAQK